MPCSSCHASGVASVCCWPCSQSQHSIFETFRQLSRCSFPPRAEVRIHNPAISVEQQLPLVQSSICFHDKTGANKCHGKRCDLRNAHAEHLWGRHAAKPRLDSSWSSFSGEISIMCIWRAGAACRVHVAHLQVTTLKLQRQRRLL